MYLGRHDIRYCPYVCRLSALAWYLSTHILAYVRIYTDCEYVLPAGLTIGATSFSGAFRGLWRMFLRSPICPASSLPLTAAAANPRVDVDVVVVAVTGRLAPLRVATLRTERARDMAAREEGTNERRCPVNRLEWSLLLVHTESRVESKFNGGVTLFEHAAIG